jgi:hypothetical protein
MDTDSPVSRSFSSRRCIWIIFLFLLLLLIQPAPARGREPRPETRAQAVSVSVPLLADGWSWRKLFNPVQSALGNRRRMIQFATIGMCLGLYILMRK